MDDPTPDPGESMRQVSALLDSHRDELLRYVRREARGLIHKDGPDDLVQDIHLRALKQAHQFTYQGEQEFLAWMKLIARQQIADRADHWGALRRQAGELLRITSTGSNSSASRRGVDPAGSGTGPGTFAERREMVERATRAVSVLPARDREIVGMVCQGKSIDEIGARFELAYDGAETAKRRALERFRKTFELLLKRGL